MMAASAQFVPVTLRLAQLQHRRLHEAAKKHGYMPSVYAQLLFEAGFAARVGQLREQPATDAELDRQVTLALILAGIGDSEEIARATGLPESLVVRILDAWRDLRRGKKAGRSA